MRVIEITVSPNGETSIQTKGYAGRACQDATRDLENALGLVTSDTPTAESRQPEKAPERLRQGQ